jgi:hypothetical protein
MIPDELWKSWLALWFIAGPILLGIASLVHSTYVSHRHLDAMMEALKNSRYIYIWGPAWRGRGWFGKMVLLSKIAGMVVWSRPHIRCGEVNAVDIENFPPHLKRLLTMDLVVTGVSFVWLIAVGLLLRFK